MPSDYDGFFWASLVIFLVVVGTGLYRIHKDEQRRRSPREERGSTRNQDGSR